MWELQEGGGGGGGWGGGGVMSTEFNVNTCHQYNIQYIILYIRTVCTVAHLDGITSSECATLKHIIPIPSNVCYKRFIPDHSSTLDFLFGTTNVYIILLLHT